MAEEIKELIEKIQQEGVRAAENKARAIENLAHSRADEIVKIAQAEAAKIIAQAKDKVAKAQNSSEALLKQAGRDFILSLKTEINAMLDKLIASGIRQAFNPGELMEILNKLIKNHSGGENIMISLSEEDFHKLEKGFLGGLREEVRKGIVLKPAEDIRGGFIISYDNGKSSFDFSDQALAEYIGSSLKPKLKEILQ